jgi:hypothetical protein
MRNWVRIREQKIAQAKDMIEQAKEGNTEAIAHALELVLPKEKVFTSLPKWNYEHQDTPRHNRKHDKKDARGWCLDCVSITSEEDLRRAGYYEENTNAEAV